MIHRPAELFKSKNENMVLEMSTIGSFNGSNRELSKQSQWLLFTALRASFINAKIVLSASHFSSIHFFFCFLSDVILLACFKVKSLPPVGCQLSGFSSGQSAGLKSSLSKH